MGGPSFRPGYVQPRSQAFPAGGVHLTRKRYKLLNMQFGSTRRCAANETDIVPATHYRQEHHFDDMQLDDLMYSSDPASGFWSYIGQW